MVDLSQTNGNVTLKAFIDMANRVDAWYKSKGSNPNIVYTDSKKVDYIQIATFLNMRERYRTWVNNTGKEPGVVYFKAPVVNKSSFQVAAEAAIGAYTNLTGAYNNIKAKDYSGYSDDIYSLMEEIQRLKGGLPLNCSDFSQFLYIIGNDLGGYTIQFVHLRCQSGQGHIVLRAKGNEFGNSWKYIDGAAAAKSDYDIGSYWCSNGVEESYDDPWLLTDDGKT